ncbi:unnamed protein product, partial [Ectocarpus sp. 12 AP-2014]
LVSPGAPPFPRAVVTLSATATAGNTTSVRQPEALGALSVVGSSATAAGLAASLAGCASRLATVPFRRLATVPFRRHCSALGARVLRGQGSLLSFRFRRLFFLLLLLGRAQHVRRAQLPPRWRPFAGAKRVVTTVATPAPAAAAAAAPAPGLLLGQRSGGGLDDLPELEPRRLGCPPLLLHLPLEPVLLLLLGLGQQLCPLGGHPSRGLEELPRRGAGPATARAAAAVRRSRGLILAFPLGHPRRAIG